MEEYNLLFLEKTRGIAVLESSAYKGIISNRPTFPHEDLGNFYSEVARRDLTPRVHRILEEITREKFMTTDDFVGDTVWNLLAEIARRSLGKQREIVQAPFVPPGQNVNVDYIINYSQGLRIYCPGAHQKGIDHHLSYASLAAFLLYGLSNEKDATAMKSFDAFVNEIRNDLWQSKRELAEAKTFLAEFKKEAAQSGESETENNPALFSSQISHFNGERLVKAKEILSEATEKAKRYLQRLH